MSNNQFTFIGNLVNDSEIKSLPSGLQILSFRLAVSDGYGEKKFTDYHSCKAFGKTAEYNTGLKKGDRVLCYGRVKSNSSEKDGKKTWYTDFVADRIYRIQKMVDEDSVPVMGSNKFDSKPAFNEDDLPF